MGVLVSLKMDKSMALSVNLTLDCISAPVFKPRQISLTCSSCRIWMVIFST